MSGAVHGQHCIDWERVTKLLWRGVEHCTPDELRSLDRALRANPDGYRRARREAIERRYYDESWTI